MLEVRKLLCIILRLAIHVYGTGISLGISVPISFVKQNVILSLEFTLSQFSLHLFQPFQCKQSIRRRLAVVLLHWAYMTGTAAILEFEFDVGLALLQFSDKCRTFR